MTGRDWQVTRCGGCGGWVWRTRRTARVCQCCLTLTTRR